MLHITPTLFPPITPAERAAPPAAPPAPEPPTDVPVGLTDRQARILAQLDAEPVTTDTIIERTGLAAHEVFQEMTLLSLKGVVARVDGQTYARKGRDARGPRGDTA